MHVPRIPHLVFVLSVQVATKARSADYVADAPDGSKAEKRCIRCTTSRVEQRNDTQIADDFLFEKRRGAVGKVNLSCRCQSQCAVHDAQRSASRLLRELEPNGQLQSRSCVCFLPNACVACMCVCSRFLSSHVGCGRTHVLGEYLPTANDVGPAHGDIWDS